MLLVRFVWEKRSPLAVGNRGARCHAHGFAWACSPTMPTQSRGHGTRNVEAGLWPKIQPAAVVAADLIRFKVRLVLQRSAALDKVAQIHERPSAQRGLLDDAEHVPRPQRPFAEFGFVEAINGGQRLGQ